MKYFHLITLFPEMFSALQSGIVGRAQQNHLIALDYTNPRDFTSDAHHTVDDKPYGGGPGMVMLAEPLSKAIDAAKARAQKKQHTIYLSPQGKPLTHEHVTTLSQFDSLILVCGRYEGIDERIIQTRIDSEYSIGDYVLSGGELPAMVMIDAITRTLEDALGDAQSALQDSFVDGLLDHPHYTRPALFEGLAVPEVLLSGNHKAIEQWRKEQALKITQQKRPDLLDKKK